MKNCDMLTCSQISDIQQIKFDVKEIKDALLGTEFNEKEGLVNRLTRNEKSIKWITNRIIFLSGVGSGIGIFIGILIGKLWK